MKNPSLIFQFDSQATIKTPKTSEERETLEKAYEQFIAENMCSEGACLIPGVLATVRNYEQALGHAQTEENPAPKNRM